MWARQTQVRLLKALAHPVRLQIVTLLCQGDQCVCHLRALVGKPQPYVSQQLAVLNRAGLVETTRDGLHIYYRVKDERVAELCALTREMAGQPSSPPPSWGQSLAVGARGAGRPGKSKKGIARGRPALVGATGMRA